MKKKEQGFTLIEIIVVLLIIGILLAITIPSIMGYVSKAKDAQLLTEARSVLLAAKTKGTQLCANNELSSFDKYIDEIMEESQVDGELISLELNKKKDSSGDFILHINNRYIYYDDEKQSFEVKDKLENAKVAYDRIINTMLTNTKINEIISSYFIDHANANSIDSEGSNYGQPIKEMLNSLGYDTSDISFRIYNANNLRSITISQRITKEMNGQSIQVTRYNFGNNGFDSNNYIKQTGTGKVAIKDGNLAFIDISRINDWQDVSN